MPKLREFQKDIVIKPSLIRGAGLGGFAKRDMPLGTRLGWYRGMILSKNQWLDLINDKYTWEIDDPDNPKKHYYIDAYSVRRNNKLRFINGCKTPGQIMLVNVEAYQKEGRMWYKTIRNVRKGEEFIVDYGDDYWNDE